jgi:hypothetical protein
MVTDPLSLHDIALLGVIPVAVGLLGWCGPAVLDRLGARIADPMIRLVSWVATVAALLFLIGLAGLAAFLPPKPSWHGATDLLGWCWRALGANLLHLYPAVHLIVATVMTLLIGRLSAVVLRQALRRQRRRRRHLRELRLIGREVDDPDVLLVPYDGAAAYSIDGKPGTIAITTGLQNRLTAAELSAVVHHERAHLLGRHHALLRVLNALATAFPMVPLFVRAAERAGLLIELVADAQAARRVGPRAVANALLVAAGGAGPPYSLAMSANHIAVRLDQLREMDRDDNARSANQGFLPEARLLAGLAGTALAAGVAGIAPALGVVASVLLTSCPLSPLI